MGKRIYRNEVIGKDSPELSKRENERLQRSKSKNTYYELDEKKKKDPIDKALERARSMGDANRQLDDDLNPITKKK